MSLIQGYSPEAIQTNVRKIVAVGYSPQQAATIAHDIADEARRAAKEKESNT